MESDNDCIFRLGLLSLLKYHKIVSLIFIYHCHIHFLCILKLTVVFLSLLKYLVNLNNGPSSHLMKIIYVKFYYFYPSEIHSFMNKAALDIELI